MDGRLTRKNSQGRTTCRGCHAGAVEPAPEILVTGRNSGTI